MKIQNFDINEFLRYIIVGFYFSLLLYFSISSQELKEIVDTIGSSNIFELISLFSIASGTMIYTLYRAFFYPLIINIIITLLIKKRFLKLSNQKNERINNIITNIDIKRWSIENESIKAKLYEWASQIHFLYTLSISSLLINLGSFFHNDFKLNYGFLISIVSLLLSVIHHYRYKVFELKIIYNS
jgi:hypothetical protein